MQHYYSMTVKELENLRIFWQCAAKDCEKPAVDELAKINTVIAEKTGKK